MKKVLIGMMAAIMMMVIGCSSDDSEKKDDKEEVTEVDAKEEDKDKETDEKDNEDKEKEEEIDKKDEDEEKDNTYEGTPLEDGEEKEDLTLIVSEFDKDAGFTIDNSDIYASIQELIDEDPKVGDHDDISFYPLDIIEYEDGGLGLGILIINRLNKPIKNVAFDMELGKAEGEMVLDEEIFLEEGYIGELGVNETMPFFLSIDEEEMELFYTLTESNLHLEVDNFKIDFVE